MNLFDMGTFRHLYIHVINLRFSTQKSADPLSLLSNISGNLNTAITRWRSLCTISHDRRVGWSVTSDFYSQFRFAYFGWFSLLFIFTLQTLGKKSKHHICVSELAAVNV